MIYLLLSFYINIFNWIFILIGRISNEHLIAITNQETVDNFEGIKAKFYTNALPFGMNNRFDDDSFPYITSIGVRDIEISEQSDD